MRKLNSILLITYFGLVISFTGCAITPKEKISVLPKPVEEKLIWSSQEKRPDWLEKEPYKEEENLLFIGISDRLATEKDARDNALRAAISRVVGFVGTDVKDKFERLQTSYGLSADIIDPTIVTRRFEQQFSDAVARRVKAREWYLEKYEARYKRQPAATYYLAYVLAFVPEMEVNRQISSQLEYQEELSKTAKSAQGKLNKANNLIVDADNIWASQPVQAFEKYRNAIRLASEARIDVQPYSEIKGIPDQGALTIQAAEAKLKKLEENPEAVFKAAVLGLAKDYKTKPIGIAVAKVNYQDTDMASKFAQYFVNKLEETLSGEPLIYRVISQQIFQDNLKRNEVSIGDFLMDKGTISQFVKMEGLIFARYWEKEDSVECKIDLLEIGSGRVIGSTLVDLPKKILPPGIEFNPLNLDIANQALQIFGATLENKDFKIKVWPDKGEGAVYKEGEDIVFHFRADRDCCVYLYHADSEGNVKLLFPNSYNRDNFVKAGQVYSIPSEVMNFSFKSAAPFGSEIIKAIATLQPIKDIETSAGDEAFRTVGKLEGTGDKDIRSIARAISAVPKEARSESLTAITTVR